MHITMGFVKTLFSDILRVLVLLAIMVLVLWIVHLVGPDWFWHPLGVCVGTKKQILDCKSYNWWSGIGADLAYMTVLASGIVASWRAYRTLHNHMECHEETCHKLGVHKVEGTPYRTCWIHHPHLSKHDDGKVPMSVIAEAHRQAMENAS